MRTIAVFLMLFVSGLLIVALPTSSAGARSWKIWAGGYVDAQAVQATRFLPTSITIDEGDSVTWTLGGNGHTIYFPGTAKIPDLIVPGGGKGELLFNSIFYYPTGKTYDGSGPFSAGVIEPGFRTSTTVTFTKAGTYKYLCAFHAMGGVVVVQPAGSPYPKTQAQYDAMGRQEAEIAFADGRAQQGKSSATAVRDASGKTTYTITLIGSNQSWFTSLRFLPGNLKIKAGDTVTWKTADPTDAHTVTFLSGQRMPDLELFQPNKTVIANPVVMAPVGGHVYAGQGYFNSGLMDTTTDPQAVHTYSLTFTTPGRFDYVCILHAAFGMVGTITVTK